MDYARPIQAIIPGVQGRVLAVLAATETELTMRTVAALAEVSTNRAVSVLHHLVALGVVRRRDVGRAALVSLDRENEAAKVILALARLQEVALARLRDTARSIQPVPESLIVFGSFAAGTARIDSDVDILIVRSMETDEDDPAWIDSVGAWVDQATRIVGSPINVLAVSGAEVPALLRRNRSVWRTIAQEGIVLRGAPLEALATA